MNTHVLRTSIVSLMLAVAGHAQSPVHQLRADIPFEFKAGGATLNAGEYTVDQTIPGVVTVRSDTGKTSAFVIAGTGRCTATQTGSRLVFHRYGSTYLLSEIWTDGEKCGRQMPVTARERELAAAYRVPDKTVVLAIR